MPYKLDGVSVCDVCEPISLPINAVGNCPLLTFSPVYANLTVLLSTLFTYYDSPSFKLVNVPIPDEEYVTKSPSYRS